MASSNPVSRPLSSVDRRSQTPGAFPSPFQASVAPPTPAIKHVLQWFLSTTSEETPIRLDMLAQAVLLKLACAPNEWIDLSQTVIKLDLLSDIISRIVDGSSNQQFSAFNLVFERDGNKVRFTQSK
jgi:cytochrome c-type biogenesis protein CcmH/NrfF